MMTIKTRDVWVLGAMLGVTGDVDGVRGVIGRLAGTVGTQRPEGV